MKKNVINLILVTITSSLLMMSCDKSNDGDGGNNNGNKNEISFTNDNGETQSYEIKYVTGGSSAPAVYVTLAGYQNGNSTYLVNVKFWMQMDNPATGTYSITPMLTDDDNVKCTIDQSLTALGLSKALTASSGSVTFNQFKKDDKDIQFSFEGTFYESDNVSSPIEGGQSNIKVKGSFK